VLCFLARKTLGLNILDLGGDGQCCGLCRREETVISVVSKVLRAQPDLGLEGWLVTGRILFTATDIYQLLILSCPVPL